ncbi:MAG: hypothetical protein HY885_04655 [Deltaproteobacteria bacterium]|nr:hypothetical protein [Deltaproteobacteria bacterium]
MNWSRTILIVVLLIICSTQVAWARWRGHGHGHGWRGNVDIFIGPPLLGWRYYPPPYYYDYPPPYYLSPPPPSVYIERAPAEPVAPEPQSYWYYCPDPQGYYPSVRECPGGWLKVLPQTQPTP